ncbi:GNAT family N-acetyltransferase [Psychromicrobium xiongbiense]|uniref:GNAT family N-acetyltransferase n=1 Tax=Psychromicrobium xiongbiense TaxID=3051184 RepID=UPI002554EFB2|nr:GNAT family N-acetyltransferase [Psychromicrobium sp. YIM S02556]
MSYEFRSWQAGDEDELLQIWGDPEGEQNGWYRQTLTPDRDGGVDELGRRVPWKRTMVAVDQGIPVAAGVVMEQQLHSSLLAAYVEVARDHRRQGLGTDLLEALRRAAAESAPQGASGEPLTFSVKVDAGTTGEAFARARGMRVVQNSRVVLVEAGALALPRFPRAEGQADEDAGSELVQDLATGSVELTDLVGHWYEASHQDWSPTGTLTPGATQRYFLADATGAQGAIVLRGAPESAFGNTVRATKRGRIRAFAVSYGTYPGAAALEDPAAEVLLGWEPSLSRDDSVAAVRDLLALVAYQHPVVLEVEDSLVALDAVVDPLIAAGTARVLRATQVLVG